MAAAGKKRAGRRTPSEARYRDSDRAQFNKNRRKAKQLKIETKKRLKLLKRRGIEPSES